MTLFEVLEAMIDGLVSSQHQLQDGDLNFQLHHSGNAVYPLPRSTAGTQIQDLGRFHDSTARSLAARWWKASRNPHFSLFQGP